MDSMKRLALLVEIVDRRVIDKQRVGKTVVQKLCFLLQEHLGVGIDYDFRFYTYGPYATAVMGDIDYAVALGMLNQEYDPDEGFDFSTGRNAGQLNALRTKLRKVHGDKLNALCQRFGKLTARQLELRATVVFIRNRYPSLSDEELLKWIMGVKPKYAESEIRGAVEEFSMKPHPSPTSTTKRRR